MIRKIKHIALLGLLLPYFLVLPAHAQFSDTWEFLEAVEDGDYKEIMKRLGNGANINGLNGDGIPAVILASEKRDMKMLRFLLEQGAKPDTTAETNGETALIRRADAGDNESIKALLEFGANINARDNLGETALIKAIRGRKTRTIQLLLDSGADPMISDYTGNDAFRHAERSRGGRRILQMLEKSRVN